MTLPNLGISPMDVKILTENVSIVFHAAATVKFDEALKSAVEMNLKGTMRLIELSRKMDKLEVTEAGARLLLINVLNTPFYRMLGFDSCVDRLRQLRPGRDCRNDIPATCQPAQGDGLRRLDGRGPAQQHNAEVISCTQFHLKTRLTFFGLTDSLASAQTRTRTRKRLRSICSLKNAAESHWP